MSKISDYAIERDEAIVSCIETDSVEPFKRFVERWEKKGVFPMCFSLPSDEVIAISVRQMCLHCTNIEPIYKGMAVDWLTNKGYHLDYTSGGNEWISQ